jgi:hypothetical protein
MTLDELEEVRRRDSNVRVYHDKHGGEYVMNKDGRIHGGHAVMDRRRLLKHVDELGQRLIQAGLKLTD